jgi:polar amino acid transport system substrate-binding protein
VTASRFRIVGLLAAMAIVLSACSSSTATAAPTKGATVVATAPADQLIKAGTLTVCSDTSYPPQESLDASNMAVGSDIDLVTEIAARMGLTVALKSTVFDSVIPALTGGSCDIIVSAQTITSSRLQQVDMIPYFAAGQSFVVPKGNPQGIKTVLDLCGKIVAAEKGTVEADNVSGAGDYQGAGLGKQCTDAGKQAIGLKEYDKDTDALLALSAGTVVAHFTDEPVAGYEVKQNPDKYEVVAALTLEHSPEGISVTKNHSGLRDAVKAALLSMMSDGKYMAILTAWNVQSGAITAADVNATPAPAAS